MAQARRSVHQEVKALNEAALSLASGFSLDAVLQKVVDLSRQIVSARYGALGVSGPDGHIEQLITSGISHAHRARIGHLPQGRGLLGVIMREGKAVRVADISQDPRSAGVPAHHPPMRSLLGVPIVYRDRQVGVLYLAEKETGGEFTDGDLQALSRFGVHAAIAIESARSQEAERRRTGELDRIVALDRAVLGGESEQRILALVAEMTADLTGADFSLAATLEPHSGQLRSLASYGLADFLAGRPDTAAALVCLSQELPEWVPSDGGVIFVANLMTDIRCQSLRYLVADVGCRSALAALLVCGDHCIGLITAAFTRERQFCQEDMEQMRRLAQQASVVLEAAGQQEALRRLTLETVQAMAEAIESRDPTTGGHCHRLTEYAVTIGNGLGLDQGALEVIRYGAAMHDVGKIGVSDAILTKRGPLTSQEWEEMRRHPFIGAQMCQRVPFLREVVPIVRHHHERYDGKGYADGLAGKEIPLGARIVAVADAYDAMTSHRPYRLALSPEQAITVLRQGRGKQWDGDLVELLIQSLG